MSEDAARAWTWLEALHVLRRCDPEAVTRKACEYRAFVDESPCSTPAEEEVRDQIALDVARTQVDLSFFRESAVQASIARALFVYQKLSGVAYVQGMNELMATIFWVVSKLPEDADSEALAFFAFLELMIDFRVLYEKECDSSQLGINAMMYSVRETVVKAAPLLARHLDSLAIEPILWAFRPATCLFAQDFLLPDVLVVWDRMLVAEDKIQFLVCALASIALVKADELITFGFAECMKSLQNVADVDVASVLRQTDRLQPTPSHLREK